MFKHVDLCSGIGGFALGFEWAGLSSPVMFCDIEPWSRKVLAKHWPDVPIEEDVKVLANEPEKIPAGGRDTILTAGYPCQPFSQAGKRRGTEDDRHIWPYIREIVAQKRPAWCVLENVYGHVSMGLDEVLFDLEADGYATRPFIVPACSVDAPHRRDRVWIVGYSQHDGSSPTKVGREHEENGRGTSQRQKQTKQSEGTSKRKSNGTMANTRREHGSAGNATELDEEQSKWAPRTIYSQSSGERQSDATDTKCKRLEGGKRNNQRGERKTVSAEQHDRNQIRSEVGRSSRVSKQKDATDTDSQRGRGRQTKRQDAENVRQSSKHQRADGERMETAQSESSLCGMDDGLSTRLDGFDGWHREPEDIPRVAVGIKDRANRLKGLGNAIVPQIAMRIGLIIKEASNV